jgi:hypothetical protein
MDISLMDLAALAKQIRKSTVDIWPGALADQLEFIEVEHRIALIKALQAEKHPAPTVRARVNVSTSVKGVVTTDTTLEYFADARDYDADRVMELRKELSAAVDAAYPPPPLSS